MRARIPVVAQATFREAVRDRVLLTVVFFVLGLVLFSRVLGWLSIEDELKMVQDFSLSGLNLLGLFLAMSVGAFSVAREVERRTIYTVLSRDLRRSELVLGKFAGLCAVFWVCLTASAAVLVAWLSLWGGGPSEALLAAVVGLLVEAMFLTAVAMFLGCLAGPVLAAAGTLCLYLVGHSTEALRELTQEGMSSDFAPVYTVLYRLLPNLEDVNFINGTTSGFPVFWQDLGLGALSVGCWTALFLVGTVALMRRKEF